MIVKIVHTYGYRCCKRLLFCENRLNDPFVVGFAPGISIFWQATLPGEMEKNSLKLPVCRHFGETTVGFS